MAERVSTSTTFKDLPLDAKVDFILSERTPKKEQLTTDLTIEFLDPKEELTREERGKVVAMGDRTAISYRNLKEQVLSDRNKPAVLLEGESVSATSAFYLQYALAARSSNEIAHTSILEQLNPGPYLGGGDSPIIVEGVCILPALRDICSLEYFGFEAFSSRGGVFPPNYRRIPKELMETGLGSELEELNGKIYDGYISLTRKALKHYLSTTQPREGEKAWQYRWRVLNLALDDSRQVTNGTFLNHFSMHPNSAVSLREAIIKLSSSNLPENVEIANRLRSLAEQGLPTLMRYTEPSEYTKSLEAKRRLISDQLDLTPLAPFGDSSRLLSASITPDADRVFLTSFLSKEKGVGFKQAQSYVSDLSESQINSYLKIIFEGITMHDKPPQELQAVKIAAHLKIDVGAIFDLIRHRPVLDLVSDFTINNGYTVPESFVDIGAGREYSNTIALNEEAYEKIASMGGIYEEIFAPYFVSRAHLQHISMLTDAYEGFHLLKIRADQQAHPNVRPPMEALFNFCKENSQIFSYMPRKKQ